MAMSGEKIITEILVSSFGDMLQNLDQIKQVNITRGIGYLEMRFELEVPKELEFLLEPSSLSELDRDLLDRIA